MASRLETIAMRMEELRPEYERLKAEHDALHARVGEEVWKIIGRTIIRPDGASFALGRVFHALEPLRGYHEVVDEFEDLRKKGSELRRAEAELKEKATT